MSTLALLAASCLDLPASAVDVQRDAAQDSAVGDAGPDCSDQDNDGYLALGCVSDFAPDCADTDFDRNPGALDACGNAIDENCDGTDLSCDSAVVPNTITAGAAGTRLENGVIGLLFDSDAGSLLSNLHLSSSPESNLLMISGSEEIYAGVNVHQGITEPLPAYQWLDDEPIVTTLARGSAVLRLRIQSQVEFLTVVSLYTIYPDGRIHRDEHAMVSEVPGNGILVNYLALDAGLFTQTRSSYDTAPLNAPVLSVVELSDPNPVFVHIQETQTTADSGWACAFGGVGSPVVSVAHDIPDTTIEDTRRPRVTVSAFGNTPDHLLSLIFDWARNNDLIGNTLYRGNFIIWSGVVGVGDECEEIDRLHQALLAVPPQLQAVSPTTLYINAKTPSLLGSDSDDDGDGFFEGGGFWALQAETGSNELEFSFSGVAVGSLGPQNAAIRMHGLALGVGTILPTVELDGAALVHGRDYLWQVEDEQTSSEKVAWIYFARALDLGEQVSIRVPEVL